MFVDFYLFLVRHTPFWAIPVVLICLEYAYFYWIKESIHTCAVFVGIGGFAGIFVIFYYWAGGPERSVEKMMDILQIHQ